MIRHFTFESFDVIYDNTFGTVIDCIYNDPHCIDIRMYFTIVRPNLKMTAGFNNNSCSQTI